MKYISLFILFTAFFLISCEKEIDFKGKEEAPRMVLNAIVNPDSCIKVFLSESQFFLSTNIDYKTINDAKVYVWRNGVMLEELTFDGTMSYVGSHIGVYVGSFIPSIGDKIKITAEHPDFPPVESEETEIPALIQIISIDTVDFKCYATKYSAIYTGDYIDDYYPNYETTEDSVYRVVTSSKVRITFNDPEKIKNYYRVFVGINDKYDGENDSYNRVFCYSTDLVFSNSMMGLENTCWYNEFNDLLFDGETYTLTIGFYQERSYNRSDEYYYRDRIPNEREITVRLESLCESNYKYYSSLSLSGYVGDGVFSEPVQIYSNIKGGMGIAGAYSVSRSTIQLPQWEEMDYFEYNERKNRDYDEYWNLQERHGLGLHYSPWAFEY